MSAGGSVVIPTETEDSGAGLHPSRAVALSTEPRLGALVAGHFPAARQHQESSKSALLEQAMKKVSRAHIKPNLTVFAEGWGG